MHDTIKKLEIDNASAVSYCDIREAYCKKYYRDGQKKGFFKKIGWGGTFFNRGTHDPQRAKKAAESFSSFLIICKNGLAKPEWVV